MKLTAEQHQKNLEHLATLTPEMMEGMTVAYLRKLLAGVNIANISRDGELVNTTRARKPEIIAAIYEMTTKPRVLAQVELTELSPDDIKAGLAGLLHSTDESLSSYAQKTFEDLRDYTIGQWDVEHQRWKMDTQYPMNLSLALFVWLESYRTVEGHELNGPTKVVYASRIRNSVKKLIKTLEADAVYLPQLLRHYEQLKVHNHKLFNELTSEKRTEQKERATFRQGNSQPIDPTLLLEQARLTLAKTVKAVGTNQRNCDPGESVRWHDVSIALVLCTGRRPSEIHATAEFTYVDDDHLEFSGQLKKKDIDQVGYIIPTLAPSKDCIAALEFLKRNGKYHKGEPEKAHKRVSSEISKYGIKTWFEKCLPNVEDYTDDNGKVFKVRTHYRMREIYTLISLDLFEKSTDKHLSASDKVRYIASILGHEDNSKAYEAYDANFYLVYEDKVTE